MVRGPGKSLAALAAVTDDTDEITWSATDMMRRADRVLFGEIEPDLRRWPVRERDWLAAFPAESERRRVLGRAPAGRVAWSDTYRRFGWPPASFVVTGRQRLPDELLMTTLRWTIEQTLGISRRRRGLVPEILAPVAVQLGLIEGSSTPPRSTALQPFGRAHRIFAPCAARAPRGMGLPRALMRCGDRRPPCAKYARAAIYPDDSLQSESLHLAALGEVLWLLRDAGAQIVSVAPITASSPGPAYRATLNGQVWDSGLSEASGAWSYYGCESPYLLATTALPGTQRPLSPDIMIIRPGQVAIILECKYSANPSYVGHKGVVQLLAYAAEARTALASAVLSRVIAPVEAFSGGGSRVPTVVGEVGIGAVASPP